MKNSLPLLLFCLALTFLGCRSDQEQIRDAILIHVEALEVQNAPFRAYSVLSSRDKKAMDPESFAVNFAPTALKPEAKVRVADISLIAANANALVLVSHDGKTEERVYTATRDADGKWRVDLNIPRRNEIQTLLGRASGLAAAGDMAAARELLAQASDPPFRGSRPELVTASIDEVRASIEDRERGRSVREKLNLARSLELDDLEEALDELASLVKPDEEAFQVELVELEHILKRQLRARDLGKIVIESAGFRNVRRDGAPVKEGVVTVRNTLDSGLATLVLTLEFMNADDVVGVASYVVMRDELLPAGESREFIFRIDADPEGWTRDTIRAVAGDFTFAGDRE